MATWYEYDGNRRLKGIITDKPLEDPKDVCYGVIFILIIFICYDACHDDKKTKESTSTESTKAAVNKNTDKLREAIDKFEDSKKR